MAEYRLVDDRPGLLAMLADVGGAASVAVDAEGCDLGRHGKLCLLQVGAGADGALRSGGRRGWVVCASCR